MAQPWVTGPCDIWVGIGSSFAPVFLGYTERGPRIQIRPQWSEFYTDIGGSKTPFDRLYEDGEGMVTADLNYYNESVYAVIADKASPIVGFSNRGVTVPGNIGSLVGLEKLGYPLWLRFPYAAKVAMAGLPSGYRFLLANLDDEGLPELGTRAKKLALRWFCQRQWDSTYVSPLGLGYGKFTLYDGNMTGLGAIN